MPKQVNAKITYKTKDGEVTEVVKLDEKQPNLFGEVDSIINVLTLESVDLTDRIDKLDKSIESSEEKRGELTTRLMSIRLAIEKARSMAARKVKNG